MEALFISSLMMPDLSEALRVGANRMEESLASDLKEAEREAMALAVGSREEVLTAAMYCREEVGR